METTLSHGSVSVNILHKGAELSSIYNDRSRIEYIWQADPAFWPKSSPVLFPIVGQLKNNTYRLGDARFGMPRHGFAREKEFALEESGLQHAVFLLRSDDETRAAYPFDFELRIRYSLHDGALLNVSYEVLNGGSDTMYFSLGAHPAFRVPLIEGESYNDYWLEFEYEEAAERWTISPEGLIENTSEPLLKGSKTLKLKKELFYQDALVFKGLRSSAISIRSDNHDHGVVFTFQNFPYFGIWAFRDADFVCLEPWCGIADHVDHDQEFTQKEGILRLEPGNRWERAWSVRCF